jgi:hypothetical protein
MPLQLPCSTDANSPTSRRISSRLSRSRVLLWRRSASGSPQRPRAAALPPARLGRSPGPHSACAPALLRPPLGPDPPVARATPAPTGRRAHCSALGPLARSARELQPPAHAACEPPRRACLRVPLTAPHLVPCAAARALLRRAAPAAACLGGKTAAREPREEQQGEEEEKRNFDSATAGGNG